MAAEVASLFVSTADEEQLGSRALPEGPWEPPPHYQSSPLAPALNITFTRFSMLFKIIEFCKKFKPE